ncbi:hypothetical protein HNQ36_005132 [Afipia massiliensis]|uniref:Uncharacterized protein n=1 Tax=Afipia massiliensis TaxID=211460 RepID=A0A840NBU5_9BRAD|nr:hypothetical protein [Afipia massiliensis]
MTESVESSGILEAKHCEEGSTADRCPPWNYPMVAAF